MRHCFKIGIVFFALLSVILFVSCGVEMEKNPTETPNLVGKWTGKGEAALFGNLAHRESTEDHIFSSIVTFTIEIKEQQGSVFYGVRYSEKHSEDIVGYICMDNKSVFIADQDGYFQGTHMADGSLFLGYLEAGLESRVAAVAVYSKQ